MLYFNLLDNPGINFFGITIYYYALMILSGIIVATALSALMMKRRNMSPYNVFLLFICCIPSAIICARLYYCITEPLPLNQWINIREGGLSILGGVMGGVFAGFVVCKVRKVNFLRMADCVVITILIAQAIGRWGNYFNQEVYGKIVTDTSQQWFPFAVYIDNVREWHYALFFYEGVINVIGFALLYTAAWFFTKKPNGLFTCAYFIWYGTVRTIMEPLRDSQFILNASDARWSQITSICMIVVGIAGIVALLIYNYVKEGSIIGSKEGDSCAITEYVKSEKDEQPYYSKINILGENYPVKSDVGGDGESNKE